MPSDLYPAPPDIQAVASALIATYFPHLQTARLAILARDEPEDAGMEDGLHKVTVAATGVNSGDKDVPFEYVIWFALDVWQMLDERARNAIVFHELEHCGRDENGKPVLKPHDAAVFNQEVKLYGVWWESAQEMLKARNDTRKDATR